MSLLAKIKKAPAWNTPLGSRIKQHLERPVYAIATLRRLNGVHPRECPVCDYQGMFRSFGTPPRQDARCPECGSLERHRLLALMLRDDPEIGTGEVIHFAPEPEMRSLIRPRATRYRSADLFKPGCDLRLDLEAIDLPSNSIDLFVASHLLEHVDDKKALDELFRCLVPGGKAILMVPIIEGWAKTYENPSVSTPSERHVHFGQSDHVRFYGRDFRDRVKAAGFTLCEFSANGEDSVRYSLAFGGTVFIATKP